MLILIFIKYLKYDRWRDLRFDFLFGSRQRRHFDVRPAANEMFFAIFLILGRLDVLEVLSVLFDAAALFTWQTCTYSSGHSFLSAGC
eukprot:SAG31_NODE_31482_length_367_cov_1.671642_1_plen_86_part_01